MADIEITDNSGMVLEALARAKEQALTAIGLEAEGFAKENVTHIDTGRLRNSIAHAVDGDFAYIGTNVEYAPYIEEGSRTISNPDHMLRRAASEHTDRYKALIKTALEANK